MISNDIVGIAQFGRQIILYPIRDCDPPATRITSQTSHRSGGFPFCKRDGFEVLPDVLGHGDVGRIRRCRYKGVRVVACRR